MKNYKAKEFEGLNIAMVAKLKKINKEQKKIIVETINTKTLEGVGFESKKIELLN